MLYSPAAIHTPNLYALPSNHTDLLFLQYYKPLPYLKHLYFLFSARNILLIHHFSKYVFLVLQTILGVPLFLHGTLICIHLNLYCMVILWTMAQSFFSTTASNHHHLFLHKINSHTHTHKICLIHGYLHRYII